MPDQPTDRQVRQVLVHPAVWPHLEAWLASRHITLDLLPPGDGDALPTYVMTFPLPVPVAAGGAR